MEVALLLFGLIARTVQLAPEIADLVARLRAGEPVSVEDVERVEAQIARAADEWDAMDSSDE